MKRITPSILGREPWRSISYLIGLSIIRTGIQIALFRQGFVSVAADEFARGIVAATWAQSPHIDILADIQGIWLPFEKYLNGIVLLAWSDAILAPRLTIFFASCMVIVAAYLLFYYLFSSFAVAALGALFMTFQPWYVWLSGTPMLEMYYFACFFAGLLLIIIWLKEERKGYWFWAGLCFLFATGIHVQSWTYVNLVNLLTLPFLFRFVQRKDYTNLSKLVAYYFLSNGFIISFVVFEFHYTGKIFAFFANHTSYSKWYYGGYNTTVLEKLLFYPKLVIQNASAITWISLLIALAFLSRDPQRKQKLTLLLLGIMALTLNSVLNVISVPPTAAPARYSLFYVILLSPYVAYGAYNLFLSGRRNSKPLIQLSAMALAMALFLYGIAWGAYRVPDFPQGMAVDSVEVGRKLGALLDETPGTYMVELRYWDYLAVNLASRHNDAHVFDREQNYYDRDVPSVFWEEPNDVCENALTLPDLRYVVLKDEDLKARIAHIPLLRLNQQVGQWTIYEVIPESERSDRACN